MAKQVFCVEEKDCVHSYLCQQLDALCTMLFWSKHLPYEIVQVAVYWESKVLCRAQCILLQWTIPSEQGNNFGCIGAWVIETFMEIGIYY